MNESPAEPNRARWRIGCFLCLLVFAGEAARGDGVTLANGTSSAFINTQSQFGHSSWSINGAEELYQQQFWVRSGQSAAELAMSSLPTQSLVKTGSDQLEVLYRTDSYDILASYQLFGSQPEVPVSRFFTSIEVTNRTGHDLAISIFHYADFDLNGAPGGEIARFIDAQTVRQTEGDVVVLQQIAPIPQHRELNFYSATRDKLTDAYPTTLDDVDEPLGPGDVTWAFQWDFLLEPYGTTGVSISQYLALPEPASAAGLGLGLLLASRRRRGHTPS